MPFKTIISSADMHQTCLEWRLASETIAFIPTMGALHEGHLTLVREAKKLARRVVVSIFVNPLQFGPQEDFAIYPRTLQADSQKLMAIGIDALFLPNAAEMYPDGFATYIVNPSLASELCGHYRPNHFSGVLTVVAKLFNIVQPNLSVFGKKDFQQCHLIYKMVEDLCLPLKVIAHPTLREADGLAMSSRNARLSAEERQIAPHVHQAMQNLKQAFQQGTRNKENLLALYSEHLGQFPAIRPEYAEFRSKKDLSSVGESVELSSVLIVAAYLGSVRLIDNLEMADS